MQNSIVFQIRVIADTPQIISQNRHRKNLVQFFLKATATPITKPHKHPTKKENHRPVFFMNTDETCFNKILVNGIQEHIKRSSTIIK